MWHEGADLPVLLQGRQVLAGDRVPGAASSEAVRSPPTQPPPAAVLAMPCAYTPVSGTAAIATSAEAPSKALSGDTRPVRTHHRQAVLPNAGEVDTHPSTAAAARSMETATAEVPRRTAMPTIRERVAKVLQDMERENPRLWNTNKRTEQARWIHTRLLGTQHADLTVAQVLDAVRKQAGKESRCSKPMDRHADTPDQEYAQGQHGGPTPPTRPTSIKDQVAAVMQDMQAHNPSLWHTNKRREQAQWIHQRLLPDPAAAHVTPYVTVYIPIGSPAQHLEKPLAAPCYSSYN
jgi:hypothetical protein